MIQSEARARTGVRASGPEARSSAARSLSGRWHRVGWLAPLVLAAASAAPDEPRVVPLTVAVDRGFRSDPAWSHSVGRAVAAANLHLGEPLGVRFDVERRCAWAPAGDSLDAFLGRLREQVGPRSGGVVVGVTSLRPAPRHVFGVTDYRDALVVVSVAPDGEWGRELAHELAHVFGAIDVGEGLMAGAGGDERLDAVNARLVSLHRYRSFPPAAFPLEGARLEAAAQLYREATSVAPAEAWRALVHLERARGNAVEALRAAARLVAERPDAASLDLRAQVLTDLGRLDESTLDLQEALARQPRRVQSLHNLAVVAARDGRAEEAIALYRRALEVVPDYAPALADLSRLFVETGRPAEAVARAQRAVDLQPDLVAAHVNLAAAQLAAGEPGRAEASARAAVARAPTSFEARATLAATLLATGRDAAAADELERALPLAAGDPRRLARVGVAFENAGRGARALEAFDAALAIEPEAQALAGRGRVRLGLGDAAGAVRDLRAAVALAPDDQATRVNLATAHLHAGSLSEAEAIVREVLLREPSAPRALATLALVEQRRGNLAGAVTLLDRAAAGAPEDPEVLANLGTLQAQSGMRAEALGTYRRLLEVRPDDALCHNDVAVLYFREGRLDAARRHAERAIALGAPVSEEFLLALRSPSE